MMARRVGFATVTLGWHCWNGVNKTKGIEQSTVQRHEKQVELERRGEGGGRNGRSLT